MKINKKKLYALWIALSLTCFVIAQNSYDLNGTFEGSIIALDDSMKMQTTYWYQYDLIQDGPNITGKSIVYNNKGYYAEVQIHGIIVDDNFYFEEYGTIDQISPEDDSWCYESGRLKINQTQEMLTLEGLTKSFSKNYGILCRNSEINLQKILANETDNYTLAGNTPFKISDVSLAPNPTENVAHITFTLLEGHDAIIEVYNLEGELILTPLSRYLEPGDYKIELDLSFEEEGMYIVELILDKKIFSTELYKSTL